ncbi:MAG: diacylglycerol kinase [Microbacterium sp.]|jgi:YegS/Rv2252/BmrU family lipid kinase|uniref:diacylglycerol/lipid kinase family protein n=1 Tax=Microbacterium sp. TaxID=51671 RepID=UPI00281992EC|nr:diacylglycerol kinase family protein [Microbacterium sp.]MDR2323248.1 diacylglycerol kinase [Microbacterium sp.]
MTIIGVVRNPVKLESEEEVRAAILERLPDADVRVFDTTEDDPGRAMAEEAIDAGCALVFAAGGDGTVRAVAGVLAGTEVALGILPHGTGNLLARNLGVPLTGTSDAVAHALSAESRRIDVGTIEVTDGDAQGEHLFVVMAGLGLDARMLEETDEELKAKAGWLAYVKALGAAAAGTELVPVELSIDDEPRDRARIHTLMIGNCGTIQGGITLLPDAVPDDGLLDLLLISADGVADWFETVRTVVWDNGLRRLLGGETTSTDVVRHAAARRVDVELGRPQPFQIDGEERGQVRSFTAGIRPGALLVRA